MVHTVLSPVAVPSSIIEVACASLVRSPSCFSAAVVRDAGLCTVTIPRLLPWHASHEPIPI